MFELDGVKLVFEDEVLDYIVDKAIEFQLGARGLRSLVETVMMTPMFDIPSQKVKEYVVTLDFAKSQVEKANMGVLAQQN